MSPDELVEKVARAIAHELSYTWGSSSLEHDAFREAARAALRVALEEAAKACEEVSKDVWTQVGGSDARDLMQAAAEDCAAAIRALVPKD